MQGSPEIMSSVISCQKGPDSPTPPCTLSRMHPRPLPGTFTGSPGVCEQMRGKQMLGKVLLSGHGLACVLCTHHEKHQLVCWSQEERKDTHSTAKTPQTHSNKLDRPMAAKPQTWGRESSQNWQSPLANYSDTPTIRTYYQTPLRSCWCLLLSTTGAINPQYSLYCDSNDSRDLLRPLWRATEIKECLPSMNGSWDPTSFMKGAEVATALTAEPQSPVQGCSRGQGDRCGPRFLLGLQHGEAGAPAALCPPLTLGARARACPAKPGWLLSPPAPSSSRQHGSVSLDFFMILFFSIISGLQRSLNFLLHSKATQSHIRIYILFLTLSSVMLHPK